MKCLNNSQTCVLDSYQIAVVLIERPFSSGTG